MQSTISGSESPVELKEYWDYSYKVSPSSAAGYSGRHDTWLDEHLVQDNKANLAFW